MFIYLGLVVYLGATVLLGPTLSMEIPQHVSENVRGDDFRLDHIINPEIAQEFLSMSTTNEDKAIEQMSLEEVGHMVLKDATQISDSLAKEETAQSKGRKITDGKRFCLPFCTDFYSWCKKFVCQKLVKINLKSLVDLPVCLGVCAVHTFSCCFTDA